MDGHKIFKNAAIPVILMIVGLCRYTQNLPLSIIAGIGIYAIASSIDRFRVVSESRWINRQTGVAK